MKHTFLIMLITLFIFSLSSCQQQEQQEITETGNNYTTQVEASEEMKQEFEEIEEALEEKKLELKKSEKAIEKIKLSDNGSQSGEGYTFENNILTVSESGNYEVSGILSDGQILVETEDEEAVNIILAGINITNSNTAPVFIKNAKQTIITLVDGSENILSDSEKYSFDGEDDEPNATIFSKDELVIMGEGSLKIQANYNDGIASKDELYILSGNIEITSVDDGIRGKDYLQIDGGNITITAEGDTLKSDNEEKAQIIINEGIITLSAGDDAIHSEQILTMNNGEVNILKSYEGFEGRTITINDGKIDLVSSDDAFNAAGGASSEQGGGPGIPGENFGDRPEMPENFEQMRAIMDKQRSGEELTQEEQNLIEEFEANRPQRPDQDDTDGGTRGGGNGPMEQTGDFYFYIHGGVIHVNAGGDGLDSNGHVEMTGGEVYLSGPTADNNSALDYNGDFKMTGGILVAAGSSGMAENIGGNSTQYGVLIGFDEAVSGGTEFSLQDSTGKEVIIFSPEKKYKSIVVSIPELQQGEQYTYFLDGEQKENFTLENIATTIGTVGRGMGGGFRR